MQTEMRQQDELKKKTKSARVPSAGTVRPFCINKVCNLQFLWEAQSSLLWNKSHIFLVCLDKIILFFFSGIVSVIIDSNLHFSNVTKSVLPQEATPDIAQNRSSFSQCWFLGTGQLRATNGQKAGELSHREMDMQCKKERMWFMNLLKKCLSKSL